jgi:predicted RNA-binding Zn-ribbon protein involved in translation (DUF1610 family)
VPGSKFSSAGQASAIVAETEHQENVLCPQCGTRHSQRANHPSKVLHNKELLRKQQAIMQVAKLWIGESKEGVHFFCPGCNQVHGITTKPEVWTFNGDFQKPTFSPSVLVRSGHYIQNKEPGNCWCDFEKRTGMNSGFKCFICHSFVKDGRIQLLDDCSHSLAGQTVDLPPWMPLTADNDG